MRSHLESLSATAFQWFLQELASVPFCHVEASGKTRGVCYVCDNRTFRLPTDPGIYVVYPKDSDVPVYAGEGGNLRQRVEYHFSESESAKKFSTLKKKLKKKGFRTDAATYELVRFKHVVVPFGRKEIESLFHAQYGINTKEKG